MAEKIKCPIHGNELELVRQDELLVAICNCNVNKNPYKGKAVYQKHSPISKSATPEKVVNKKESE